MSLLIVATPYAMKMGKYHVHVFDQNTYQNICTILVVYIYTNIYKVRVYTYTNIYKVRVYIYKYIHHSAALLCMNFIFCQRAIQEEGSFAKRPGVYIYPSARRRVGVFWCRSVQDLRWRSCYCLRICGREVTVSQKERENLYLESLSLSLSLSLTLSLSLSHSLSLAFSSHTIYLPVERTLHSTMCGREVVLVWRYAVEKLFLLLFECRVLSTGR